MRVSAGDEFRDLGNDEAAHAEGGRVERVQGRLSFSERSGQMCRR